MTEPHHIVVVGGGAAGLELVTKLGDTLGKRGKARITLVEKSRTHLWKPLLHSVAAGSINRSQHELNFLAQAHWHHFTYRYGKLTGLDRAARRISLGATTDEEGREITPATTLAYDTLVIAVGSVTNDFGTPGAAEHAVPLETPEQASRFNRRLVNACLRANTQDGPVRPGQLHVAIIGAGATGTELAAELHRTVRAVVAYGMDRINPERDVRIVLIEAAPRILPALPERISRTTEGLLAKIGVIVRAGARVAEVRADGVVLSDGELIPAELVVWSAGVKAPEVLRAASAGWRPTGSTSSWCRPRCKRGTPTCSPSGTARPASWAAPAAPSRPARRRRTSSRRTWSRPSSGGCAGCRRSRSCIGTSGRWCRWGATARSAA